MPKRAFGKAMLALAVLSAIANALPQQVNAYDTIYIRADGSIDPPTAQIFSVDNITCCFTDNIYASIIVEKENVTIDGANYMIQGPETFGSIGLHLLKANHASVKNVQVSSFWYGICVNSSRYCVIASNNAVNNTYIGIYVDDSPNASFHDNSVVANKGIGLYIIFSSNCAIQRNSFAGNGGNGISIWESDSCILKENIFTDNNGALYIVNSDYNQISANVISDNHAYGIGLWDWSFDNLVTGNHITNSGEGIIMHASSSHIITRNILARNNCGFALHGTPGGFNLIFCNEIVNNIVGVYLEHSTFNQFINNNLLQNEAHVLVEDSVNHWNGTYSWGGNYWSGYDGTDLQSGIFQNETGSDGVGDLPYIIDTRNVDNYPLMGMFSDFNATSEVSVQTICNSSISDFTFNGTVISFNVTGESETSGFCRICIPTALMNNTFRVFINGTEQPHRLLPCSNSTHSYLYFNYSHSTQEVVIIPEFAQSFLFLIMVLVLVAAITGTRMHNWHAEDDVSARGSVLAKKSSQRFALKVDLLTASHVFSAV